MSANLELWSPEGSDKGLEDGIASFQLKPPEYLRGLSQRCGFVHMNLYELKQLLQNKEPMHFIPAPAHQALKGSHNSALWIMEGKKKLTV